MIFKTLLKYKIFEYCLEAIVTRISFNFPKYIGVKVNNRYRRIEHYCIRDGIRKKTFCYYNCNIISINKFNQIEFYYKEVFSYRSNKFISHGGNSPSQCCGYIENFVFTV